MSNWTTYNNLLRYQDLRITLDTSRMDIADSYTEGLNDEITKAYSDLVKLEAGEIANPDEGRMVGHYWLRDADLAPNDEIRAQITDPIKQLKQLAEDVVARATEDGVMIATAESCTGGLIAAALAAFWPRTSAKVGSAVGATGDTLVASQAMNSVVSVSSTAVSGARTAKPPR